MLLCVTVGPCRHTHTHTPTNTHTKQASADGSTMTTHTADCAECDFRLARVPARDWPEGAMRPVYLFASACE